MDGFLVLVALAGMLQADDRFAVREAASAWLVDQDVAEPTLRHFAISSDPEVVYRSHRGLAGIWCRRADHVGKQDAVYPWIDSLPLDVPDRDELVHGFLSQTGQLPGLDWANYRHATKLMVMGMVAAGQGEGEIGELLAIMQERCKFWEKNKKYPD
jgi:hypothetical protein